MPGTYEFDYQPTSPYGHAVALLSRWREPAGEVVIDLGCGYGAVAEPVTASGLAYLGVDADPAAVDALRSRGLEAMRGDLTDPEAVVAQLNGALGGRRVAALLALDALEHLENSAEVLVVLARFARELGGVPLVVSIPNVSHRDLAIKLLLGRWDVTPTGLLDETHVRFFSPAGLDRAMAIAGWKELESYDFAMVRSDQHFPPDCAALIDETPLGGLLHGIRDRAAPGAIVNQFVRAYGPAYADADADANAADDADEADRDAVPQASARASEPFLTVVVRTDASKPAFFDDLLLALAGQEHDDFEVVVVPAMADADAQARIESAIADYDRSFRDRVRVVDAGRPISLASAGNLGAAAARGRYVVFLGDDQVPFGDWVSSLAAVAGAAAGRVVHCGVATQETRAAPGLWQRTASGGSDPAGGAGRDGLVDAYDVVDRPRCSETYQVDLLELLTGPPASICGFALPRSLFTDMGERYDEDLPALEDWDLLLRAFLVCGVVTTGGVGLLRRIWADVADGESADVPADPDDADPDQDAHPDADARPDADRDSDPVPDAEPEAPAPAVDPAVLAEAYTRAQAAIASKLDAMPLLLDRGSARRLVALMDEAARARETIAALTARAGHAEHSAALAEQSATEAERRLADLHASSSWRVTAPMRAASEWWRRRGSPPGS